MKLSYVTSSRILGVALLAGLCAMACSSDEGDDNPAGTGGAGVGGHTSTGGKSSATGGKSSSSTSSAKTGGAPSTGGATATGGASNTSAKTGGAPGTGGQTAVGGAPTGGVTSINTGTNATGGMGVGGITGTGGSQAGGTSGIGGGSSTNPDAGETCPSIFDFETDIASWAAASGADGAGVSLAVSSVEKSTGTQSLKVTLPALTSAAAAGDAGATTDKRSIQVTPTALMNLWPGAVVKLMVWAPADATNVWVQVFSQSNNWGKWDNTSYIPVSPASWKEISYTIPEGTLPGGIQRLGLQIGVNGGGTFAGGDLFVDAVSVCDDAANQSCAGSGTGSYGWETAGSADGWAVNGNPSAGADTAIAQSTAQASAGAGSLAVTFTSLPAAASASAPSSRQVGIDKPNLFCGQTVTFKVWIPAGAGAAGLKVQPFVHSDNFGKWNASDYSTVTEDGWSTVTYVVPSTINSLGIQRMGLNFSNTSTTAAYSGTAYVDAVSW